jgi:hypothetical protein
MRIKRSFAAFFAKRMTKVHPSLPPLFGMLVIFGLMFALSEPLPYQAAPPSDSPTPRSLLATFSPQPGTPSETAQLFTETPQLTATRTPLPPEFLANREQTFGIIIGTVVLVILVIGGSLVGIWTRRQE